MDRRQRKTKQSIQMAVLSLIEEGGNISELTAKDVADKADINRSTFYLHYKDVRDVIDDIAAEASNKVLELFNGTVENLAQDLYPTLKTLGDEMEKYPTFFNALKDAKYDFYDNIETRLSARLSEEFLLRHPTAKQEAVRAAFAFAVNGAFGAYSDWRKTKSVTLEELCKTIGKVILHGFLSLMN